MGWFGAFVGSLLGQRLAQRQQSHTIIDESAELRPDQFWTSWLQVKRTETFAVDLHINGPPVGFELLPAENVHARKNGVDVPTVEKQLGVTGRSVFSVDLPPGEYMLLLYRERAAPCRGTPEYHDQGTWMELTVTE